MKLGFIGMGRLGAPIAGILARQGHSIWAYDRNPDRCHGRSRFFDAILNSETVSISEQESAGHILFCNSLSELINNDIDILLICINTEHALDNSNICMSTVNETYSTENLKTLLYKIEDELIRSEKNIDLAIFSTLNTSFFDWLSAGHISRANVIYCPQFARMGCVLEDFSRQHWIVGVSECRPPRRGTLQFIKRTASRYSIVTQREAVLIKQGVNAFRSAHITFANAFQSICADHGDVAAQTVLKSIDSVMKSGSRIYYIGSGLPDGGPCRPRDLSALIAETSDLCGGRLFFVSLLDAVREGYKQVVQRIIAALPPQAQTPKVVLISKPVGKEYEYKDSSPAETVCYLLRMQKICADVLPYRADGYYDIEMDVDLIVLTDDIPNDRISQRSSHKILRI